MFKTIFLSKSMLIMFVLSLYCQDPFGWLTHLLNRVSFLDLLSMFSFISSFTALPGLQIRMHKSGYLVRATQFDIY